MAVDGLLFLSPRSTGSWHRRSLHRKHEVLVLALDNDGARWGRHLPGWAWPAGYVPPNASQAPIIRVDTAHALHPNTVLFDMTTPKQSKNIDTMAIEEPPLHRFR